ncbi:hypothetical protein B0I35DRAFT_439962 [Stachybotrys elegans]|uniref:Oxidoreductase NAD-binding domain-containing protein 1 n=1 Tax=Stachybotrys elegans TaxID=80388 RepID=A0A8K0SM51_9HYPO|nr:hypothetical protein B0I35DRAFT_439962 [Stachybotrys elegans]
MYCMPPFVSIKLPPRALSSISFRSFRARRTVHMDAATKTRHMERTSAEPRGKSLHAVTIDRIDGINERIRLFRLGLQTGPAKFLPGQWLDTYIPGSPKAGGFTITSTPSAAADLSRPYLELAVQHADDGPAAWLWRPVDEILGTTLQVRVGGSFVCPPQGAELKDIKRLVFIAGGVGINPLMSMLGTLAEMEQRSHLTVDVLYATKVPRQGMRHVLFLERIAALFGEKGFRGQVRVYATGGGFDIKDINCSGVEVKAGRPSLGEILNIVGEQTESTYVYVCGPPTMTDEIVEGLTNSDNGVLAPDRVLREKWW